MDVMCKDVCNQDGLTWRHPKRLTGSDVIQVGRQEVTSTNMADRKWRQPILETGYFQQYYPLNSVVILGRRCSWKNSGNILCAYGSLLIPRVHLMQWDVCLEVTSLPVVQIPAIITTDTNGIPWWIFLDIFFWQIL